MESFHLSLCNDYCLIDVASQNIVFLMLISKIY